jgi:DNA-binding NarL/FixJ family response regulator
VSDKVLSSDFAETEGCVVSTPDGLPSAEWKGRHVRIVVSSAVQLAVPELADVFSDSATDLSFGTFDRRISPDRISETVARFRPEVVLVDSSWLVLSTLLLHCLVVGGCPDARCALGSFTSSDALKILASRRGFFDIVDLGQTAHEMLDHVRGIHLGESRLRQDRLWTETFEFAPVPDLADVTVDELDLQIVDLLSVGSSDREIALAVHLSLQAVRNRVSAMLERSGCVNRTQLGWAFSTRRLVELLVPYTDSVEAVTPLHRRDGKRQ